MDDNSTVRGIMRKSVMKTVKLLIPGCSLVLNLLMTVPGIQGKHPDKH